MTSTILNILILTWTHVFPIPYNLLALIRLKIGVMLLRLKLRLLSIDQSSGASRHSSLEQFYFVTVAFHLFIKKKILGSNYQNS